MNAMMVAILYPYSVTMEIAVPKIIVTRTLGFVLSIELYVMMVILVLWTLVMVKVASLLLSIAMMAMLVLKICVNIMDVTTMISVIVAKQEIYVPKIAVIHQVVALVNLYFAMRVMIVTENVILFWDVVNHVMMVMLVP